MVLSSSKCADKRDDMIEGFKRVFQEGRFESREEELVVVSVGSGPKSLLEFFDRASPKAGIRTHG